MQTYKDLIKNLTKDYAGIQKLKVAILGDTSTQMLVKAIRGYGYSKYFDLDIFEADYNQIDFQVFDPKSELYRFNPEYVIVFHSTEKLVKKYYSLDDSCKQQFAIDVKDHIANIYFTITSELVCKVICFNFVEFDDLVFGNFSSKIPQSIIYQIRKLNVELMDLSQNNGNLFIHDIANLQNTYGSSFCRDEKMYVNADLIFSLDFLPVVARNLTNIILAISGHFKKCLILDLDNTLWGGIVGDDGIDNIQVGELGIGKAFSELQMWIKQLKQRGIILAVCSKNNEDTAKEPFVSHPEMVLKLEDFAVFVANWENKADNIRYIQSVLNIGFDSIVFLDDNPFERNLVRSDIAEITVPELPEDPAEYLGYLRSLNLFETASYTKDDEQRTQQYREESRRAMIKKQFHHEEDYLSSLNMISKVNQFDNYSIPRIAQLAMRSNQFNLRTIRYTEEDIQRIVCSNDYLTLSFTLYDNFGEYGLVSAVILNKQKENLFIDTWIMSCRVLKRGMENFVLDQMIQLAIEYGFENLIGEFLPTSKNMIVKEHYLNLGFNKIGDNPDLFLLDVNEYKMSKTHIKKHNVQR